MRLVRSNLRHTFGLALLAAGLALGSSVALAAGDAAKGKQNFMKYGCWQCHGTMGQGSPVSGPKLAPDPLPYEAMSTFIRLASARNCDHPSARFFSFSLRTTPFLTILTSL